MGKSALMESVCNGSFSFLFPAEWDYVPRKKLEAYKADRFGIPMNQRIDLTAAVRILLMETPQRWTPFEAIRDITENLGEWDDYKGYNTGKNSDRTHDKLYAEYCYFTDKVRPLIYNTADCIKQSAEDYLAALQDRQCVSVILKRLMDKKDSYYVLLRKQENGFILYGLPLTGIQLRLYASGTMTLSICCNDEINAAENKIVKMPYHTGDSLTPAGKAVSHSVTAGDIAWIRDAGRRLFWPSGCRPDGYHPTDIAAVYSALIIDGGDPIVLIDYRSLLGLGSSEITKPEYFEWLADLIGPACVSQKKLRRQAPVGQEKLLVIHYFNDDRMLLHNTIVSKEYAHRVAEGWKHRGEIESEALHGDGERSDEVRRYWDEMKSWYAIMACDSNWEEATCQDIKMLIDKCEEATDARWVEYDTMYATYYNCMTQLIGPGDMTALLSQNMDWMYYQLFMLAIMQRSTLQRFYREASGGAMKRGKREASVLSADLKQKYVQFMNCMWFTQVTEQEQGCDFFRRLQNNMRLTEDMELLEDIVEELNSMASKNLEDTVNNTLIPLTFIDLFLAFIGSTAIFYTDCFDPSYGKYLVPVISTAMMIVSYMIYKLKQR